MLKISVTLTLDNVDSRISAKTSDGKEILSRTQGEPYFFTFGKSEVGDIFSVAFILSGIIVIKLLITCITIL